MDPDIEQYIKHNVMHEYNSNIKFKVLKLKERNIKKVCERKDLGHVISLVEKESVMQDKS